jgi:transposase
MGSAIGLHASGPRGSSHWSCPRAPRFLLAQHLRTIEQLEERLPTSMPESRPRWHPFATFVERLKDVPGLGSAAVETIIAEIGLDMSLFPTAGHLLSWAGLVPRLDESAGKRRSPRIKKGALAQTCAGAVRLGGNSQEEQPASRARLARAQSNYPQKFFCLHCLKNPKIFGAR